jgi:hypothetical protein
LVGAGSSNWGKASVSLVGSGVSVTATSVGTGVVLICSSVSGFSPLIANTATRAITPKTVRAAAIAKTLDRRFSRSFARKGGIDGDVI